MDHDASRDGRDAAHRAGLSALAEACFEHKSLRLFDSSQPFSAR